MKNIRKHGRLVSANLDQPGMELLLGMLKENPLYTHSTLVRGGLLALHRMSPQERAEVVQRAALLRKGKA